MYMKISELQNIVIIETICLLLIMLIIVAAIKRWRGTLITSCILATVAFFTVWSNVMAFGSMLVYGSASTLLWWQMDKASEANTKKYMQGIVWGILALGVTVLIMKNSHYIYTYLR